MKAVFLAGLLATAACRLQASPLEGKLLDAPGLEYRNMARGKALLVEWIRDARFLPDGPRRAVVRPRSIKEIRASLEWRRDVYSTGDALSRPIRMDSIAPSPGK